MPSSSVPEVPESYQPRQPKGTMMVPYQKKKVAICGVGGYLGSVLFGLTQRAASLYPYGVSDRLGSPRGVSATAIGGANLNTVLGSKFALAFAGEDKIALTNMTDYAAVSRRLKDYDVVFAASDYKLANAKVTANTYEGRNPNAWTVECFMEGGKGEGDGFDEEMSLDLLRRIAAACEEEGKDQDNKKNKHLIVMGCGDGKRDADALAILSASKARFTFIYPAAETFTKGTTWTFIKGLVDVLLCDEIEGAFNDDDDDDDHLSPLPSIKEGSIMALEDLAAFALSTAMMCDPSRRRVLRVVSTGRSPPPRDGPVAMSSPVTSDKVWLVNQQYLLSMLESAGVTG